MTATLALNLAPGPDMLYVSTRSLTQGRRAGVISALGIAAGCSRAHVAIASGLAALLRAVPLAYEIVRFAGAAYLIWLGVQALRSKSRAAVPARRWIARATGRSFARAWSPTC